MFVEFVFLKSRSIQFTVTLVRLKSIARYTGDVVVNGFITSGFQCSLVCFIPWGSHVIMIIIFFYHRCSCLQV